MEGYKFSPSTVVIDTEAFVQKHAAQIDCDQMVAKVDFSDSSFPFSMSLGNNLLAKTALFKSRCIEKGRSDEMNENFNKISGAAFYVKGVFKYPTAPPFNVEFCLQYFNLYYEELNVSYEPRFANLSFLQPYEDVKKENNVCRTSRCKKQLPKVYPSNPIKSYLNGVARFNVRPCVRRSGIFV
uniref:Uncharacterized protein n=1 Tax=Caenorhabditis japonica TaxID=281687 RepID=A0A8R1HW94_CAEJA